jgi:hypothetical protein
LLASFGALTPEPRFMSLTHAVPDAVVPDAAVAEALVQADELAPGDLLALEEELLESVRGVAHDIANRVHEVTRGDRGTRGGWTG